MSQALLALPLPVRCRAIDDYDEVALVRRMDCSHYERCLDVADSGNWSSFSCRKCSAYNAKSNTGEITRLVNIRKEHA